ncbi:MlaD family protein [Nitrospira sp. Kam-Ns4a]
MSRQVQLTWSQVRVGTVVVLALASLVVMILNLEEGVGLLARQTRYRAVVAHTQGLKLGGPVRLNGVDVGNVREIGIAQDSPRVEIVFSVKSHVVPHIRQDAVVRIRPMGLLGDKYLEILPGTPSLPALPPGSVLPGQAETDLTGIAHDASATIESVNAAMQEIQRLLAGLSQGQGTASKLLTDPSLYDRSTRVLERIEQASDKGVRLLEKVERGEGTVGKLVATQELYDRANRALQELTELTTRLNQRDGTLAKLADPVLYQRLDALTSRGEKLLNKLEQGEGTIGKLVTQDDLYRRTDKLLTEIEELVADVKKNPTKYFKISVF